MPDQSNILHTAKKFLTLVLDGEPPRLIELYWALDELAVAYHVAPDVQPDEMELQPPSTDHCALRNTLGPRLPQLGYYNRSDTTEPLAGPSLVADALDDLVDIVQELQSFVWLFERGSVNDSLWHFRFGYEHHWGLHLRGLSLYLHELIYLQHLE